MDMKNETEKLNKFKLAVFSGVEQQAQDIVNEAQELQKQRLSEAQDKTRHEMRAELEKIEKQFEAQKVRAISSRKLEAQRNVLTHRSEMMQKVFDNVCKALSEFCGSEKYPDELKQRLDKIAQQTQDKKCTAYFARRDMQLAAQLCEGTSFTPQQSQSITLGGVTVICEETGIAYDSSFDTALEQQKQNFIKASGLAQI